VSGASEGVGSIVSEVSIPGSRFCAVTGGVAVLETSADGSGCSVNVVVEL